MSKFADPEGFAEWEASVPARMKRNPIWRTPAYRYASWLSDLAKADAKRLLALREMRNTADQLVRAVNSIGSNLSEGYGCSSGPERARYYGYALTSARESFDWYFKAREELGAEVVDQRFELLDRILRILTVVIPRERRRRRPDRPPEEDE